MGGTYGGNAVACAAAVATFDVITQENLLKNAHERGAQLQAGLQKLMKKYPICDIRGKGLMVGIEFNRDCAYGTAAAITKEASKRKMLLLTASAFENIRVIPPLVVTSSEIEKGLSIIEQSFDAVFSKK